jgi:hypothetical protein|tara:strand:- start:655 stop:879 length:225 start_codon:yes stop_codon:yes gene_type:complete
MANKIILRNRSNTASPAPTHSTATATDVDYGEVVVNYHADVAKIFFKDSNNIIREIKDKVGAEGDATALAIALG